MYIKSCCNCRNKLIPDWSTARTYHKLGNVEDTDLVMPPQEPPTTIGKFVEEVTGRVETTERLVNEF